MASSSPVVAPPPAIEARGIAKTFGHVEAIRDASITVAHGEVVALFGDNGAGKSTLVKCLLGIHSVDSGEILIDGVPRKLESIRDAQALGVEAVHQDLSLAPDLSVVDNMFLGHGVTKPGLGRVFGVLDRRLMTERADAALKELSIKLPSLTVSVGELSGGQRQAVAVARAVMWAKTAVLLDEPTAALGARQSAIVCDLMRSVAEKGLGVLVISHDLPRVMAAADRISILWRGETALEADPKTMTVPEVVAAMVGYKSKDAA